jgi:hypothetical protein
VIRVGAFGGQARQLSAARRYRCVTQERPGAVVGAARGSDQVHWVVGRGEDAERGRAGQRADRVGDEPAGVEAGPPVAVQ